MFGEAQPDGNAVFVMRKERATGNIELWAPVTGECYFFKIEKRQKSLLSFAQPNFMQIRLMDPSCPMTKLHTVVSDKNIWCNIQPHDLPVLIDFNLDNKKKWKPLFEDPVVAYPKYLGSGKVDSIQTEELLYSPKLDVNVTKILQSRIYKYLVEQFQDARIKKIRRTTRWAVAHQTQLKTVLTSLEEHVKRARKGGTTSTMRKLREGANPMQGGQNQGNQQFAEDLPHLTIAD